MDNREQFIRDFVQAGKAKGASKEEVSQKLSMALQEYDSQVQPAKPESTLRKGVRAVSDVLSIPSYMTGGILNKTNEYKNEMINQGKQAFGAAKKGDLMGALSGVSGVAKAGYNSFNMLSPVPNLLDPMAGKERMDAMMGGLHNKQAVMEEAPKSVGLDPNSIPGIAVGFAGEIATPDPLDFVKVGGLVSKLTKKAGKTFEEAGEEVVIKGVKASPAQLTKFNKETGEDLAAFMSRNKITGDFTQKSAEKIDELQGAFDDIAINSGRKVSANELLKPFHSRMNEMTTSIVPTVKSKAGDMKSIYDNIIQKYGTNGIDVSDLTKERKALDKVIKEGGWSMPIEQATYLRSARNAVQEAIQNATSDVVYKGKPLKELGIELSKFYKFDNLVKNKANLGRGSLPFGMTDLLAGGTGAMATAATGGSPQDILKNTIIATLLKRGINSPKVISAESKALTGAGKFLQKSNAIPNGMEALYRALKEAGVVATR
jgi:hypothetical protein